MESRCAACADPDGGHTHTCPGSGTFIAAEAYETGAVEDAAELWPAWRVRIHFRMRASDEDAVRVRLTGLMAGLLEDDLIEYGDFSIEPGDVQAAA